MADAADDQGQNVKAVAAEAPKADAKIDAATIDTSKIALAVAGMKTAPGKATGKSGRKFSAAKAA